MTSNTRRYFRGDAAQSSSPVLERRFWPRELPRDAEATLSWTQGEATTTIEAHLLDLGAGGAAVLTARRPPRGAVLRLGLAAVADAAVDGRAVAIRMHQKPGWSILHIKFIGECPKALYDRAVGGDDPL